MMLPMDVLWISFLPNSIKFMCGKDAEIGTERKEKVVNTSIPQPGRHFLHAFTLDFTFSYFIALSTFSFMKDTAECFAKHVSLSLFTISAP